MTNKFFILIIFLIISNLIVKSQTGIVNGRIIDFSTREPIPFVKVSLEKNKKVLLTTSTDFDGNYTISSKLFGNFLVKTSYVGYSVHQVKDVKIQKGDTITINFQLKISSNQVSEVVEEEYTELVEVNEVLHDDIPMYFAEVSSNNITHNDETLNDNTINKNQVSNSNQTTIKPLPYLKNINNQSVEITKSGKLTASELNDFSKWDLWQDIQQKDLNRYQEMWEISPVLRYSIQIKSKDDKPLVDAIVILKETDGKVVWSTHSDNTGKAELWLGLYNTTKVNNLEFSINYDSKEYNYKNPNLFKMGINVFQIPVNCGNPKNIDIAFVVDATNSMDDEINFLKSDLIDIIKKTKSIFPELELNLGSVFYRCIGNSFVTKTSSLSNNIEKTIKFIKLQEANEGGDEAVEEALKSAVDSLNWSQSARARILFYILDEQPFRKPDIINKLHVYIQKAAEKGIRIIPVVASAETPRNAYSLEYLMRSIALATNGTYVFLTDHSQVGDAHSKPTTDQYDVEFLNNLFTRIIYQFCYIPNCNEKINIDGITDTTYVFNSPIIAHEIIDTLRIKKSNTPKIKIKEFSSNSIQDSIKQNNRTDTLSKNDKIGESLVNANTDTLSKDNKQINDSLAIKKVGMIFYPNPTSGIITIEIEGKIEELYLVDISGKLISKYITAFESKIELDLSKYSTGIYFIKFLDNYKWYSGKIILTH